MLKPKPLDVASELLRLDSLMASVRKESTNADADPFDDAIVAAVVEVADAIKAEGTALDAARKRIIRMAKGSALDAGR